MLGAPAGDCVNMIQVQRDGQNVTFTVAAERRPRLYLDQFALYEFAKPEESERFFKRFETHGTLLFSHINMLEAGLLRDPSAARVQDFLRRIGNNWAPIDYEFTEVVVRENEGRLAGPRPALSEGLGKFVYDCGCPDEPITLDHIMIGFRGGDEAAAENHRRDLDLMRSAMARHVAEWQKLSPEQMDRQFPVARRAGPTLYLASRIVRALISEARAFRWTPNDAFDFIHAIVPLVYADAVFLDRQWKGRIERLQLEDGFARVFCGNEIQHFFQWFEGFN